MFLGNAPLLVIHIFFVSFFSLEGGIGNSRGEGEEGSKAQKCEGK